MTRHLLAPALALLSLTQAGAAHAQQGCAAPCDIDDAVIYAVPFAFDATRAACNGIAVRNGFLATGDEQLVSRTSAQAGAGPAK